MGELEERGNSKYEVIRNYTGLHIWHFQMHPFRCFYSLSGAIKDINYDLGVN